MDIKKQLGVKIKRLRKKQGLTQEQLAEKMSIATRTLSGIELGENFVTADTLEKVFNVFNITSDELFAFDHMKSQEELVNEIIENIKVIKDKEKIETIYKFIKAMVSD